MTTKPIELESVWWPDPGHPRTPLQSGEWGVKRIVLENTACGPMGHYGLIEIYYEDGRVTQHPAHHAEGWQLKEKGAEK